MFDFEHFAKQKFDNVLNYINNLLIKSEQLNIENLQKIYIKLKRKDQRVIGSLGLPVIGTIAQSALSHDFTQSDNVLKIAKLMNTLDLSYIDKEISQTLNEQKEELYLQYFKEEYETEAKAIENQNKALDCLYPLEQEKYFF